MRYLVANVKNAVFSILRAAFLLVSFWLSTAFFLLLLFKKELTGKDDQTLLADLSHFQKRIYEVPDMIRQFFRGENPEKNVDLQKSNIS